MLSTPFEVGRHLDLPFFLHKVCQKELFTLAGCDKSYVMNFEIPTSPQNKKVSL